MGKTPNYLNMATYEKVTHLILTCGFETGSRYERMPEGSPTDMSPWLQVAAVYGWAGNLKCGLQSFMMMDGEVRDWIQEGSISDLDITIVEKGKGVLATNCRL